jgi:HEAT repeat protein
MARYEAYVEGARSLDGGPPEETMLFAAADKDARLRGEALRDLYRIGSPRTREVALRLARDGPFNKDLGVSLAAVLGAMGDPEAVKALLAFLDMGPGPEVRQEVLDQLRDLRAPRSLDVLLKALESRAEATRGVVADILASVPDPRVADALRKQAGREKDPEVLALLLEALGDQGDAAATDFLFKKAQAKELEVRLAARRALARISDVEPRARVWCESCLEAEDVAERVLALDAAATWRDPALLPRFLVNLRHPAWQVRIAAVDAVEALRAREGIPVLIARLEHESRTNVRNALARALFRLTGVNLYDAFPQWKQWWAENGSGFEVPKVVPRLPEEDAAGTGAGFYGLPLTAESPVFVIDKSGSMSTTSVAADAPGAHPPTRLEMALRELDKSIGRLADRHHVGLVFFDSEVFPWRPAPVPLTPENRKAIKEHVKTLQPAGNTNVYDALEAALLMPDVDAVYLLSDGRPDAGRYRATDVLLKRVRRLNQTRRVAIYAVAIGIDSDLLRALADQNDGVYVRR